MKNENLNNVKKTGFKVPQNYFEEFENSILTEAKLKNLVIDSGFKAPEGYLDNFSVPIEKETKVISIFSKKNMLLVSSIAAAIVLFFSLNVFDNSPLSFDDLDTTTVDNYILNETEIGDLTYLFQDNELSENQFIDYSLSDEALDNYIENIDFNDLYSE
ncbi:hypothetical protein CLV86_2083 [Lacinutrix venerupis]|uniref:hypothetical protein n=1 Tax=Lacinutrix venerupis TaxID=1486034 RepID=UPI000EABC8BB|nr:hypothetical protein [Lacinutrix venerupis]RLJ62477.1 hypothetical protein CLV86_2083 [Lacinutrix venerupis]